MKRKEVSWVKKNMLDYIRFLEEELAKKDLIIGELKKEKELLMEEIEMLKMKTSKKGLLNIYSRKFVLDG